MSKPKRFETYTTFEARLWETTTLESSVWDVSKRTSGGIAVLQLSPSGSRIAVANLQVSYHQWHHEI